MDIQGFTEAWPIIVSLAGLVAWAARLHAGMVANNRRIEAVEAKHEADMQAIHDRVAKTENGLSQKLDRLADEVALTRRDVAALAAQIKMLLDLRKAG